MASTMLIWSMDGDLGDELQEQVSDVAYRLVLGAKSPFTNSTLMNKTVDIIRGKVNSELGIIIREMTGMNRGCVISSMTMRDFEKSNGKLTASFEVVTTDNVSKSIKISV